MDSHPQQRPGHDERDQLPWTHRLAHPSRVGPIAIAALVAAVVLGCDAGSGSWPFDALTGDEGEAVWGTAGPLQGDPLEAGPCERDAGVVVDPASPVGVEEVAALPPDVALWLRADHGVVVDTSGRVATWRDLSSAHRDFVTASGRPSPRWIDRAWHCHPALRFEGAESLMRADLLGLAPDDPRTYVAVARLRDPVERSQLFSQGESGSLYRHVGLEVNTWQTTGRRFGVYAIGQSFDAGRPTDRRVAVHVLSLGPLAPGSVLVDGSGSGEVMSYWIDGARQAMRLRSGSGTLAAGLEGATRTTVGDFPGPGEYAYRGDVFEVQVYGRSLGDDERRALEQSLAARYEVEAAPPP